MVADPGHLAAAEVPQIVHPHLLATNGLERLGEVLAAEHPVVEVGAARRREQQRTRLGADVGAQMCADVVADVRRNHHRAAQTRLRGVDAVLAIAAGDRTGHGKYADTALTSWRRNSDTSPQRNPHHAQMSTRAFRAFRRAGLMASASAATSEADRVTGARLRGGFITAGRLHGLRSIKRVLKAAASTACSSA